MAPTVTARLSPDRLRSFLNQGESAPLTADRIAEMCGVREATVYRWTSTLIAVEKAREIAEYLGVAPGEIWGPEWAPHAKADAKAEEFLREISELTEAIDACSTLVQQR